MTSAKVSMMNISWLLFDAVSAARQHLHHKPLSNYSFVMATIHEPPYQIRYYDNETGQVQYTGLCFEILEVLCQQLGFSYKIVEPPDMEWGVELPNGSYTGMIGMIVRGIQLGGHLSTGLVSQTRHFSLQDADIGIGAFTITSDRRRVVDFLQPWWEESVTYMMRKNPTSTLSNCFKPFSIQVWLCCFMALFLMALVHWLFGKPWSTKPTTPLDFTKTTIIRAFKFHLTAMKQPLVTLPRRSSMRALLACWWLYCLVVAAVYSGNLVAIMSVNVQTVPVRSVDELSTQTHTPIGIKKGVAIAGILQSSHYGLYQALWNNIDVHYMSEMSVMDSVASGDLIIIQEVTILKRQLEESKSCDLALGPDLFFKSNFGFPTKKNFSFKHLMNAKILQIIEGGMLEKWQKKYWKRPTLCSKINAANQRASLVDTFGAFVILTIGIGVALIILLLEANLDFLRVLDSV